MNNIRIFIQNFLKEIFEKCDGAEDFISDRIEEICSHEKLTVEGVIFFLLVFFRAYVFLLAFFSIKIFLHMKCKESLSLRKS